MFIPYRLRLCGNGYDRDANNWIKAVEAADGEPLEKLTKAAMNDFVLSLKAESMWSKIGTMTVKMSARTLAGALIDIKNPTSSWTNNGFVAGDYSRTTGLTGDGSSKYLNTNYNNNTNSENNQSLWTYVTSVASGTNDYYMGCGVSDTGSSAFRRDTSTQVRFYNRSGTGDPDAGSNSVGLLGMSRSLDYEYVSFGGGVLGAYTTHSTDSQTPLSGSIYDYATNNGGTPSNESNHGSCMTYIGESLTLDIAEDISESFILAIKSSIALEEWIEAVETQDGQSLEQGVKDVMKEFVFSLHSEGLWDSISTMVIKMGARTVAGAMIDVKNPSSSWINNGFVTGDYNRTTGLLGNASKYLRSNFSNATNDQNSQSMWTYVTSIAGTNGMAYMGAGTSGTNGSSLITRGSSTAISSTSRRDALYSDAGANAVGLIGISRSVSGGFTARGGGADVVQSYTSQSPYSFGIYDYGTNVSNAVYNRSDHRSCASAIGDNIDLELMETIMETFIANITNLSL